MRTRRSHRIPSLLLRNSFSCSFLNAYYPQPYQITQVAIEAKNIMVLGFSRKKDVPGNAMVNSVATVRVA